MVADLSRDDRLFARAHAIMDGRANGVALPIFRHLARRGYVEAITFLAGWIADNDRLGSEAEPFSAARLYRRALARGNAIAAGNMSRELFNRNDLGGYRLWLRRAARLGDGEALAELRRFETRLPHDAARNIGRYRPMRRSERIS